MIQIKKTILTLVALLAVTTGAWADETPLLTIESKDYADFRSGSMSFDDKVTITFSDEVENDGDTDGWYRSGAGSLLTVAGTNGYTITSCKFYTKTGADTIEGESPSVYLSQGFVYTDDSKSVLIGGPGVMKIEVFGGVASASSGPEVAWNASTKTGTFEMPGGNVTLEPEYYPQATVAEGAVTAADADARATTDDPLVKVDATKLTGAKKLMYFVSNSGTTAPAYDAEGWTDQLPTAEGFTQQGIVYVWYYPVGTDEGIDDATATYSDGDICLQSITARIAAAPTYAVTFADGVNPEPPAEPEWTASPATDVEKGQTVTVTYTGSKKVIGVKAEKKGGGLTYPIALSAVTADYLGSVVTTDGNVYETVSAATTAGKTAVAMIAYVSGSNGLAIALADEASTMNWSTANGASGAAAHTPAVSGQTWKLPSQDEWKQMFSANGGSEDSYTGLNTAITAAGGTALQEYYYYWSSTEDDEESAYYVYLTGGYAGFDVDFKDVDCHVRACLAF